LEAEKEELNLMSPQVIALLGVIVQESISVDLRIPAEQPP
jgi:hypothetical protein